MGHEASQKLLSEIHHGGCVDTHTHTQDQVLFYLSHVLKLEENVKNLESVPLLIVHKISKVFERGG